MNNVIDLRVTICDKDRTKVVFNESIFTAKAIIDSLVKAEANTASMTDEAIINNFCRQIGLEEYHPTPIANALLSMVSDSIQEYRQTNLTAA